MSVAFRNPDGSTALVVHNENDDPRSFAVAVEGYGFAYTLPGGSLATFTSPRSAALNDGPRQIDPATMTATASPNGPSNPCCAGDVAANLVDDDASTADQSVQVDLGKVQAVRRIVLDTGIDRRLRGAGMRSMSVATGSTGDRRSLPVMAAAS
jgi:glucosylceramidase